MTNVVQDNAIKNMIIREMYWACGDWIVRCVG